MMTEYEERKLAAYEREVLAKERLTDAVELIAACFRQIVQTTKYDGNTAINVQKC